MNDSISTLAPFIEPAPVAFSFQEPGWYFVGSLLALIFFISGLFILIRYYRNRYRRNASKQIDLDFQYLLNEKKYADYIYHINTLIKKMVMRQHDRSETASLQGKSWIDFLNRQCKKNIFTIEDEQIFTDLYLNSITEKGAIAFADKAKQWIKKHRYVALHRQ